MNFPATIVVVLSLVGSSASHADQDYYGLISRDCHKSVVCSITVSNVNNGNISRAYGNLKNDDLGASTTEIAFGRGLTMESLLSDTIPAFKKIKMKLLNCTRTELQASDGYIEKCYFVKN